MGERKLNVVHDERSEIDELRREIRDFRDESKLWQAILFGIVAGLGAILGAMAMTYK